MGIFSQTFDRIRKFFTSIKNLLRVHKLYVFDIYQLFKYYSKQAVFGFGAVHFEFYKKTFWYLATILSICMDLIFPSRHGRCPEFVVPTNAISDDEQAAVDSYVEEKASSHGDHVVPVPFMGTVDVKRIRFMLFTKQAEQDFLVDIENMQQSLLRSTFGKEKPVKLLIHGWLQDGKSFSEKFVEEYKKSCDYNVIAVDWSAYSKYFYFNSVRDIVPNIGRYVGAFINELISNGASVGSIHVVGHSLGAHIAGYAGKTVQRCYNRRLPYITALDAAGPGFEYTTEHYRLCRDDADFVSAIHTNFGGAGMEKAFAHIDFYPNGGDVQPGCYTTTMCSHLRSVAFYVESINSTDGFYAVKAPSYNLYESGYGKDTQQILMGEKTLPTDPPGKYYLTTHASEPYAYGKIKYNRRGIPEALDPSRRGMH